MLLFTFLSNVLQNYNEASFIILNNIFTEFLFQWTRISGCYHIVKREKESASGKMCKVIWEFSRMNTIVNKRYFNSMLLAMIKSECVTVIYCTES